MKTQRLFMNDRTFTMIMAGSGLPWVQIRRDWSSDALSHHCLLRLQLTLPTGLSCPACKERSLKWTWKLSAVVTFTFIVLQSKERRHTMTYWSPQLLSYYLWRPLVETLFPLHFSQQVRNRCLTWMDILSSPVSVYSQGSLGGRQNWLFLVMLTFLTPCEIYWGIWCPKTMCSFIYYHLGFTVCQNQRRYVLNSCIGI